LLGVAQGGEQLLGRGLDLDHGRTPTTAPPSRDGNRIVGRVAMPGVSNCSSGASSRRRLHAVARPTADSHSVLRFRGP
jgi:hypothetical protein